ncbi:MAG TPA: fasciclin domain-containing protein [Cyclobacteriaceae bacterium]|nr:fasciclin domain-containing protein [Cyclobacteriaceae bacterium]HMV11081.1 fasciclin domain-containing protein [Cyclobacteriaceae bacterium]HMV88918.1 fasciclin domain-containing protein [Cyclobacteriaceae bacterium]HMX01121.1 fasciclin domain-containing protein [Cyclobacteriaceae bacterium]HMX50524.1 fasciclin domain-containing protein [Cyclobacteriaceae bacterium]
MKLRRSNPLLLSAKMLLLTFTFAAVAIGCSDDDDNSPAPQQTVLEIAVANTDFDVLAAAAVQAGTEVTNVLGGSTQITVFAPTDAAFVEYLDVANEAAAIAAVSGLTPTAAADLLKFHVVSGSEIKAADIAAGTTAITTARSANNKAFVTKSGANVTINNARVTTADVDASNGVIHIIDAVLTPPAGDIIAVATSAANAPNFGILAAALTKADLITTLQGSGPFTVFAPTDDAFLTLLRSAAFFNNPDLTEAQVIEYINTSTSSSTPLSLTTLTQVLLYHVVPASGYSINLSNNQVLTTVKTDAPKTVTIGIGSSVTVDGSASDPSTVTAANISATNGVIHVIDKVLLP